MDLGIYQKKATETDIRPQEATVNLRLMCSILGLIEEEEELRQIIQEDSTSQESLAKDIMSEAGDVLWYCASILTELNSTFVDALHVCEEELVLSIPPAKILKKTYRDHDGVMPRKYYMSMLAYIGNIIYDFITDGFDIERITEMNIEKLADRAKRGKIQGDGDTR